MIHSNQKEPPRAATTTPAPHELAPLGTVAPPVAVAPPVVTVTPPPTFEVLPEEEPPKPAASTPEGILPAPTPRPPPKRNPAPQPAPKRPNCNPPYVVDENHIRHIKPQCL